MVKLLKYAVLGILILVAGAIATLAVGSWLSLDREQAHAAATAQLPDFTQSSGSSIVAIEARGMRFRARVAGFDGDQDKPIALLLHGFPVTSAMWTELLEPLAAAGYRVVAFDQRGYSPGARPEAIDDYTVPELTRDVLAIADAVGADRFHLAGHDWGAGVGWSVVLNHPDRVISWTGLSIAHPAAFGEALANDPDQQSRSGYFAFFQTPWLPEAFFTFNGLAALRTAIYASMAQHQADEYIAVFSEPGALGAALNWYRAMGASLESPPDVSNDVTIPTLFVWGNQDAAVGRLATEAMDRFMLGPYRKIELDAGHWLMEDEPERLTTEIVAHIRAHSD